MKEILQDIDSEIVVVKTQRLGKPQAGYIRPLKVILSNKLDTVKILKNKYKYTSSVKIKRNLTKQQRGHLQSLRAHLRLHESGHRNKTIRFINVISKIVDMQTKNAYQTF